MLVPFAVAGLGLLAARQRGASAQTQVESLVTLQWIAPGEACPDAAYVYGEIGRLLGSTAPSADDAHVNARAVVKPTKDGFRVELATTVGATKGARAIDAQSCRGAADATALIVALMVNPTRVAAATSSPVPAPSTVNAPASASVSASASTTSSPSSSSAPASSASGSTASTALPAPTIIAPNPPRDGAAKVPIERLVSAAMLADAGTFPEATLGAAITLGLRRGPWRIELAGSYLPRRLFSIEGTSAGATYRLLAVEARAGYEVLRAGPFVLTPLATFELARVDARSFGITEPAGRGVWRSSIGAAALASFALSPHFSLRAMIGGLFPFRHADFDVTGIGEIHREPSVVGRATLGVELSF